MEELRCALSLCPSTSWLSLCFSWVRRNNRKRAHLSIEYTWCVDDVYYSCETPNKYSIQPAKKKGQIGGIVDIAAMLNNHLLSIMPAHGFFLNFYLSSIHVGQVTNEAVVTNTSSNLHYATTTFQTYLAIAWGIRYAQATTVTILAVNRLTAVVFPAKFRKVYRLQQLKWQWAHFEMWTARNCTVANVIQLAPAVIMGSLLYTSVFSYETNWLGGSYCVVGSSFSKTFIFASPRPVFWRLKITSNSQSIF